MISVQKADELIQNDVRPFPAETVKLTDSHGKILAEDIFADRDQPSANVSAMDGIAIPFNSWEKGVRSFRITGIQQAGIPALDVNGQEVCVEIMTGGILPAGFDCVIPVERIQVSGESATVSEGTQLLKHQYVRLQGKNYQNGDVLLKKGERLNGPAIAVAAAVGKSEVGVISSPVIALIGTGDEIVEIDISVAPHQIRNSNVYALEAAFHLNRFFHTKKFHIPDDPEQLRDQLSDILARFDIVVLTGGVSMGKYDFVPKTLQELGVETLFHKVRQKPGKPFWFGRSGEGKPVFALPGNPVSTQICAVRYILPYLRKAEGRMSRESLTVKLSSSVMIQGDLTHFVPATLECSAAAELLAVPFTLKGSDDFFGLSKAQGFVELPEGRDEYPAGECVRFFSFENCP